MVANEEPYVCTAKSPPRLRGWHGTTRYKPFNTRTTAVIAIVGTRTMLDCTAAIGPDVRIHAPRRVCMFPACTAEQKKQTALHALQVRHRSTKYGSQAPSYVTSMDMDGINAVSLESRLFGFRNCCSGVGSCAVRLRTPVPLSAACSGPGTRQCQHEPCAAKTSPAGWDLESFET